MDIQKYTILYDTIPVLLPQYHPDSKSKSWFQVLVETLNGEDYYFAISDSARNDFLKFFPQIDANKCKTTLLACDEKFVHCNSEQIAKTKVKYNIPSDKKYVFSLCTLEPRKNLIRAVKTFVEFISKNKIEDMVFVLGGGQWKMFIGALEKEVPNWEQYSDKILKIGYVDDEDLAPLYSGAEWFVYTSMYEGFGLPPLEAMSCGCPVITSNNSSLPEVVGNAGIMIDWDNDEQHIEAYEKYYFNPTLRKENSQKGLERAKQFSWEKCANEMVDTIVQNKGNK
jgi:glycosyltransferase involved in cell wall biosynthesis